MKAPMICGGIYEWKDQTHNVLQGTLVSITTSSNGRQTGTMLSTGFAPELVTKDSERWGHFKLIGRPAAANVGRPKKKR
jgi:hypothetical protein